MKQQELKRQLYNLEQKYHTLAEKNQNDLIRMRKELEKIKTREKTLDGALAKVEGQKQLLIQQHRLQVKQLKEQLKAFRMGPQQCLDNEGVASLEDKQLSSQAHQKTAKTNLQINSGCAQLKSQQTQTYSRAQFGKEESKAMHKNTEYNIQRGDEFTVVSSQILRDAKLTDNKNTITNHSQENIKKRSQSKTGIELLRKVQGTTLQCGQCRGPRQEYHQFANQKNIRQKQLQNHQKQIKELTASKQLLERKLLQVQNQTHNCKVQFDQSQQRVVQYREQLEAAQNALKAGKIKIQLLEKLLISKENEVQRTRQINEGLKAKLNKISQDEPTLLKRQHQLSVELEETKQQSALQKQIIRSLRTMLKVKEAQIQQFSRKLGPD